MDEQLDVLPNQVWADSDFRSAGRTLRIIRTDETHALCEILTNSIAVQADLDKRPGRSWYSDRRGKTTRIRLDRFRPTSTGYRLVTR